MPLAVCATPIGNLADVTLRVLEELAAAETVLCEDTRHTRILLERHGIKARLLSYHQHNEATRLVDLVPRLEAGERMALVSDAGLPGVNDPGARLIVAAAAAGVPVTVLPGPSAVETALVASGLAGEQYRFVGYVPRTEKERAALWQELLGWSHPTVAFESPKRLPVTLASLAAADPDRLDRRVSGTDEALRGGRLRRGGRSCGAVPGGTEGRGDARDRPVGERDGRRRRGRGGRRRAGRSRSAAPCCGERRCAAYRDLPQRALRPLALALAPQPICRHN